MLQFSILYLCILVGSAPESRTFQPAEPIQHRYCSVKHITVCSDYIICIVSNTGALRAVALLPYGIVDEPFPGTMPYGLGNPLIGC